MAFSTAEENYLKAIYHLQQLDGNVSTNAVANRLKTKAASVTDMLKKLNLKQVLSYEKYKGVTLTPAGMTVALGIVRRHRLWEYFLATHLGMNWSEVHDIAEQLEHVQSDTLTDRLDVFLGKPEFDPHGDPIPNSEGYLPQQRSVALNTLPIQVQAQLVGVVNQTDALLNLISSKHLTLGILVVVESRYEFDQSLELRINCSEMIHVSEQLAKHLLVTPSTDTKLPE